jgi:Na+-translocating ferredoxin:NAD+ oxidoreductase subunit G
MKKYALLFAFAVLLVVAVHFSAFAAEPAKAPEIATVPLEQGLKKVLPAFDNQPQKEVIYIKDEGFDQKCDFERDKGCKIYPAKKKGALQGLAIAWTSMDGMKGPITILLGVSPEGDITGIEVLKHEETKNLGSKITGDEFQKQFAGKNLKNSKLQVQKDGGDIKAITGASFSSKAVTGAVKETLEFYDKNKAALLEKAKGK